MDRRTDHTLRAGAIAALLVVLVLSAGVRWLATPSAATAASGCCSAPKSCCCAGVTPNPDDPPNDCDCFVDDAPDETPDLPPLLPTVVTNAHIPPASAIPLAVDYGSAHTPRAPPEGRIRWGPRDHIWHCVFLL